MKFKILIVFCLIASLGGGGFYLLSSSGPRTPSIKERLDRSAVEKPPVSRAENVDLAAETARTPDKKEKKKEETKAPDGRTLVKGSLPPKLEKFHREIESIAVEIEEETEKLDREALAELQNPEDMEKLIEDGERLIKTANAENNIDGVLVQAEYQKKFSRPIRTPQVKAVVAEIKDINKELADIERRFNRLVGADDSSRQRESSQQP